jgi:preprotein translocase subunit SecD
MLIRCKRFNIILMLLAALVVIGGCKSGPEKQRKKVMATLRLHQEVNPDASGRSEVVTVHREPLVTLNINKAPFLTEANVKSAKVVDVMGGFVVHIQFDRQGSWLLEQYTAASKSKHIAVFSQFDERLGEKLNQGSWLAAPKIYNHITDGLFTFTPDVTRDQADQIALGLNNVAKKVQDKADK